MEKQESGKLDVHVEKALVLERGAAAHRAYLRVAIPTLIGFSILARHMVFPDLAKIEGLHWGEIITHIGIAFVVSGIVVFGYEWRSEQKNLAALTATLSNLLDTHVDRVLKASDQTAVSNALCNLAGKEQGERFATHFLSLVQSIARLRRGWTSKSYLGFLAHYLQELTDKAAGLADMSERLERNAGVGGMEYRLLMPDAPKLVDVLVEATMRELSNLGGEYYAVSDASTWDKLNAFSKAEVESLTRIHTRRIFVLGRAADKLIPPKRVHDILNSHFQQSRNLANRYEMKITSNTEYERLRSLAPELRDAEHFGIWAPKDKAPIAVLAIDDKLSNFRIVPAPPEMIMSFLSLWTNLDDLSDKPLGPVSKIPVGEAIFQDHLLAYRVSRMGTDGHYRGVSKMAMWRDGGLQRFFEATVSAIGGKEIQVQRIFVFDKPHDHNDRRVLDVIESHTRIDKTYPNHLHWRVCLRKDLPEELKPPGIAIFHDPHGDSQVLSEVALTAAADTPPRVDSQPHTFETRMRAFDDFWATIDHEKSIRLLFQGCSDEVFRIIRETRPQHDPM